jgi:hypothetical protein
MCPSISVPSDGVIPEVRNAQPQPPRGPPPPQNRSPDGDALLLVHDRDRIAVSMNDTVVHRLFSAGLSLQTVLELMGPDHPGTGRVRDAIRELDLAIRDIRNVLFAAGTGIRLAPPDDDGAMPPASG